MPSFFMLVPMFIHGHYLWKGKDITTIKHLKAKVCLIFMEHEIRLNLCPEGKTLLNKYNDFFSSSLSLLLLKGQLAQLNNYLGGTIQSVECSSLFTYQMSIIICCNSPS